jgi:hypothetical protein
MTRTTETTTIAPLYRPRPRAWRLGRCFEYASHEATRYLVAGSPEPALTIVHGTHRGGIAHAWLERGGFAYDWQMVAVRKVDPLPVDRFYAEHEVRSEVRYHAREVCLNMAKHGHHGPWNAGPAGGERR